MEKITKLDSRSIKCVFIGYSDQKKGYRLLSDGKFIVSRDVIFDETKSENSDEINNGCVQEVEGLFWHVRCNTKLKKQSSINLHGYFETLTQ